MKTNSINLNEAKRGSAKMESQQEFLPRKLFSSLLNALNIFFFFTQWPFGTTVNPFFQGQNKNKKDFLNFFDKGMN